MDTQQKDAEGSLSHSDIAHEVEALATRARTASSELSQTTADARNAALCAMADALMAHTDEICAANELDMESAREKNTSDAILDRLMLDPNRVADMADALRDLANLPDPLGRTLMQNTLYNGIDLKRISVPLGVVAIIYEARPNVTADAAGICIKSGNACVLRGGSLAEHSNETIARILAEAAEDAGMPRDSIVAITTTDRAATDALMQLHGIIDVLIPRGGAGLIKHCVESSKVPVIETGTGNCHVYVHESADLDMAREIVLNAKCRRYGVCNAAETLLVDESIADEFLPDMLAALAAKGVIMHCDDRAREAVFEEAESAGGRSPKSSVAQTVLSSHEQSTGLFGSCGTRFVSTTGSALSDSYSGESSTGQAASEEWSEGCEASERNSSDAATQSSDEEGSSRGEIDEEGSNKEGGFGLGELIVPATEQDWATEYLAPEIAVKCVSGIDEAIDHINRYGTHHSEAIVATDEEACERFLARVDASSVYANASTAFTDGGQFGLGAEIGISTQKLHARGPFALEALTSYKYILRGSGQVRA